MHRSHLKWLVVLSFITLCIVMFAWRSAGPNHGENYAAGLTVSPN